ncbi:hypothetical protein HDU82_003345, partial [Entophlyctis luteolus]
MPAPTPRELLLAGIAAEPLLVEARIDHALIDYALVSFNDDVPRCTAMFRNYARFHKDYLGHPARRVCIAHVHALYLTKLLFNLPHLTALDGSRLVIYDMAKDRIGGVPKQVPVLMAMYMFHVPYINGSAVTVINCKDIRVSNLRMTMMHAMHSSGLSTPRPSKNLIILHNASRYFSDSFKFIKKNLPSYNYTEFTQGDEIFAYVHPSMLPVDFGGNITGEQL